MTLVLEIPADIEERLKAEAQALGVTAEARAAQLVVDKYTQSGSHIAENKEERRQRRHEAIRQARGALTSLPFSIDHLEEKRAEIALEDTRAYGSFSELGKDLGQ